MTYCHQTTFFKLLKCRCADAVCDNASPPRNASSWEMPTLVDASPTRNASSWEMPTLVDASPSQNASLQETPVSADAVLMTMLRKSETCAIYCTNKEQMFIFGIQFKRKTFRNSCHSSLYGYCSRQSASTRKIYSIRKKLVSNWMGCWKTPSCDLVRLPRSSIRAVLATH